MSTSPPNPSSPDHYVPALRFRWLTPAYDTVVRLTTRERRFKRALLDQAAIRSGHEVLDLACGTGTLAIAAKQREPGARVSGVDGDTEILEIAARKARTAGVELSFQHGLSFELPYPDAHFDRVLTSLFLHHLSPEDKVRTAFELLRILKPGGELHVADWGRPSNLLMRTLFLPVQMLDGFANTADNVEDRLMSFFESAGFIEMREGKKFDTMLGTMRLFSATKP